ncbi:MAG: AsnC family transcriptional regulator [Ignavibacteria bacterium RBG_13_36_8]|nr:MAG: AsnC family transcriptional regulator [Ignavibacteria bacterium RBG_13_36_8]
MYDEKDLKILNLLQNDARITNAEIARQVEMAPSAVLERIRKLEEKGIISGYEAKIDNNKLNLGLTAFLSIKTADRAGEITTALEISKIPEVQEVHHVAGDDCYLIKVKAKDNQALAKLMREKLGQISSITSTKTTIVLETVKESSKIPLA